MAAKSDIEWTDASYTPIRARNRKTGKVGWHCEHATTGCEFCYAESLNKWFGTGLLFKPGHRNDIEIFLDEKMLTAPLRWKKPRRIFVCSMTDLFADFVEDYQIAQVFGVMTCAVQHTYQVLTKRPQRMRDLVSSAAFWDEVNAFSQENAFEHSDSTARATTDYRAISDDHDPQNPPSNVWLGASCERQQEADERRDYLGALAKQGWLTFVSYEPALGMVDWSGWEFLKWLISGGESGPNARPSYPAWHRAARDWCGRNGVAYFFKQWGEHGRVGDQRPAPDHLPEDADLLTRVGKKAAGRLLDGRKHNEFPQ